MILPHVQSLVLLLQEPTTGFTAETVGARPEVVERGLFFLNLAYTTVWVILALYIATLSIRLRRLSRQVARLKERAGL